jgi:hypothetical protein
MRIPIDDCDIDGSGLLLPGWGQAATLSGVMVGAGRPSTSLPAPDPVSVRVAITTQRIED